MRLAIFGGSGRTGRFLVERALADGHHVVALVRTPARLDLTHERLRLLQGDVTDEARVMEAVAGAQAVLSVLGPASNRPEFAVSRGTEHIIRAMEQLGARRLIISSGAGVRDPNDRPPILDRLIGLLVRTFSRNVYEDMRRTVELVRASELDWTIVRVPMLTGDPPRGDVRVGYVGKGTGIRLSRADLAAFMLRQLADDAHVRKAPAISS